MEHPVVVNHTKQNAERDDYCNGNVSFTCTLQLSRGTLIMMNVNQIQKQNLNVEKYFRMMMSQSIHVTINNYQY